MRNFEMEIKNLFNDNMKIWVGENSIDWLNTRITIKNWQGKRIYINIDSRKFSNKLFINLENNKVSWYDVSGNSTARETYKKIVDFVIANKQEIIEQYK